MSRQSLVGSALFLVVVVAVGLVAFCSAQSQTGDYGRNEENVATSLPNDDDDDNQTESVAEHKTHGFGSRLHAHNGGADGTKFMSKMNHYGTHAKTMARQAYDTSAPKVRNSFEATKPHLSMALQRSRQAYEATKPHLESARNKTKSFFGRMSRKFSFSHRDKQANEKATVDTKTFEGGAEDAKV